jgi:hypothetical protein
VSVDIVNISGGGALLSSAVRLRPGSRAELQLFGASRRTVPGHVLRCRVAGLAPLRFEGAVAFDELLDSRRVFDG